MVIKLWVFCLPVFALALVYIPFVDATTEERNARAYRTTSYIEVDGKLAEPDWQKTPPIREFRQIQPNQGEPVTQPMEARILYDDNQLYFGFIFYDNEMDKLVANEMRRDSVGLRSNDYGFLLLDTYNDRRNAVFFRFNALGGVEDTAVADGGDTLNTSWDIVWQCRGDIGSDRWTVEIALPFNQLRFEASPSMTWGLNMGREIARSREIAAWRPAPKTYGPLGKYRTAYFGSLVGLEGITSPRHLELLPYVLPGVTHTGGMADETDGTLEAGLDAKYGITHNLMADLTFNTDFAQVEADDEQVNLTRFSLFFPEKRPFFLEGTGLFGFGIPGEPPPLELFYSRRIGLAQERAIPILAGGKMTGKAGPYGIGLLNVLTDSLEEEDIHEPGTNYSVLRVTRDVFSNSSIGLIAVNKQDRDRYHRSTGLDINLRPRKTLNIQGIWARTFEANNLGSASAFHLGTDWRSNQASVNASYTDIGEAFNPEVGFVWRRGIRRVRSMAQYTPWPRRFGIRQISAGPGIDLVLDRDNELETRDITFDGTFSLETGENLGLGLRHTLERLTEDFEIREGLFIPVGDHRFTSLHAFLNSSSTRALSGGISLNVGEFFDGTRRSFRVNASIRPNTQLSIEPLFEYNHIDLHANAFDANILGGRLSYSFSPMFFTKVFVQWNSERDVVLTNFLLNYIYRPGSDLFLVFNQTFNTGAEVTVLQELTLVAKMTYWWNP